MQQNAESRLIVLVAGPMRAEAWRGHHDYIGGCRMFAAMLERVPGVRCAVVENGWPADERILEDAAAVLFYDNGGGHQQFLASPARRALLDERVAAGCGVGLLHQAIAFPDDLTDWAGRLFGAAYRNGRSRRGHRRIRLHGTRTHPIARHWSAHARRDGWLDQVDIPEGVLRDDLVPLLWPAGAVDLSTRTAGMVAWAYAPPGRGRAFVFTGGDNHRAWQDDALRVFVASGLLWSAGIARPADERWSTLSADDIIRYRTPRRAPWHRLTGKLWRRARRLGRARRKW